MTQQAVERALGKLLTDENFRDRFFANPEIATWEAGFTPFIDRARGALGTVQPGGLLVATSGRIREVTVREGDHRNASGGL